MCHISDIIKIMQVQKENFPHALHADLNPEFYDGISKMIFELFIHMPDFLQNIETNFLDYIYDNISQKRCDLLYYSRLTKHKVDPYLQRKKAGLQPKKNNTGHLFNQFLEKLGSTCEKLPDNTIPTNAKKDFVSFRSIFDQCGLGNAGYAPKAVKDALISAGCIEPAGKNKIKFKSKLTKPLNSQTDAIRQISNTIYRYISTQFQNIEAHKNDTHVLMEKAMVSYSVPEHVQEKCFKELRENFEPPYFKGKEILEKYENEKCKSTHAIGYQVFFYKTEL